MAARGEKCSCESLAMRVHTWQGQFLYQIQWINSLWWVELVSGSAWLSTSEHSWGFPGAAWAATREPSGAFLLDYSTLG